MLLCLCLLFAVCFFPFFFWLIGSIYGQFTELSHMKLLSVACEGIRPIHMLPEFPHPVFLTRA